MAALCPAPPWCAQAGLAGARPQRRTRAASQAAWRAGARSTGEGWGDNSSSISSPNINISSSRRSRSRSSRSSISYSGRGGGETCRTSRRTTASSIPGRIPELAPGHGGLSSARTCMSWSQDLSLAQKGSAPRLQLPRGSPLLARASQGPVGGGSSEEPVGRSEAQPGPPVATNAEQGQAGGGQEEQHNPNSSSSSSSKSGASGEEPAGAANGAPSGGAPLSSSSSEGETEDEEKARSALDLERARLSALQQELADAERRVERRNRALQRARRNSVMGRLGGFGAPGRALGDLVLKAREVAQDSLGLRLPEDEDEGEALPEKLDLGKLRACFSYTDFFPVDSRGYGSGALFTGNLRGSVEDARAKLQPRLSEAAGADVTLFFLVDEVSGKQVLVVQPTAEVQSRLRRMRMSGLARWPLAVLGLAACSVTIAGIQGVDFDPFGAGVEAEHLIQFGVGLLCVFGVGEIFERTMATRYGVQLSPPYMIPGPLGCLGCATRIESLVPSRVALLDISMARAVGSAVASLMLATLAMVSDGGVSGGLDPLYVEPGFFEPNWLVSFVQYVIGPYADELGNVMPNAVAGVGVPVNPLAFAGLLGIINTALILLPAGQLEGGRIAQAVLGRRLARRASVVTTAALGIGGISGSVLCLTWGFIILFFRNGPELPCAEEVTPIDKWRVFASVFLLFASLLLLLPSSAGTFPSFFPRGLP